MDLITIIIVGFGIAGNMHHDKEKEIPNVTVIGAVDIDAQKKSKIVSKNLTYFPSLEEAIVKEKPRIWDICVPTEAHLAVLKKIISIDPQAHIICEKPICLNYQIPELHEILKGFKGRIVVNENYLSSVITKKVKEVAFEELRIEPKRVIAEMDKNRTQDFQNGRYIDTEGALKYEGTHMVTILQGIGEQFCPRGAVKKSYGDAFIPYPLPNQGFADISYLQDGVEVNLFTSMMGEVKHHFPPHDVMNVPPEDTATRYRIAAIEGLSDGEPVTVVGFYEPIRGLKRSQGAVAVLKLGKVVSLQEPIVDDSMGTHLKRAIEYLSEGGENPCPIEKGIEAVEILNQMLPDPFLN